MRPSLSGHKVHRVSVTSHMDSESWENIHVQNGKFRAGLNFILIFFLSPVIPEADELEVGFKIAKNKSPKKGAILLFL